MKSIFKAILVIAIFIPAMANAQAKFGYINKQELISKMPAVAEAKKKLETFGKQLEEQQVELRKEFETKYNAYMALKENPTASKAIITTKEEELKGLQERTQKFQQTANEDFQKEQETLMKPIVDKVDGVIKAIITESKYTFIFDTSLGAPFVGPDADNITPQVKKKLGIL